MSQNVAIRANLTRRGGGEGCGVLGRARAIAPHPVVNECCMICRPQLDTHSVIEMIPVYKYEFSPEMISQSSLSQPESAGSAF